MSQVAPAGDQGAGGANTPKEGTSGPGTSGRDGDGRGGRGQHKRGPRGASDGVAAGSQQEGQGPRQHGAQRFRDGGDGRQQGGSGGGGSGSGGYGGGMQRGGGAGGGGWGAYGGPRDRPPAGRDDGARPPRGRDERVDGSRLGSMAERGGGDGRDARRGGGSRPARTDGPYGSSTAAADAAGPSGRPGIGAGGRPYQRRDEPGRRPDDAPRSARPLPPRPWAADGAPRQPREQQQQQQPLQQEQQQQARPDSFDRDRGGGSAALGAPRWRVRRLLGPSQPQAQLAEERSDLAAVNVPVQVHQLIGDPRSGVADDTTTNPFGEVTVDLVHHQISNEVYWFKYELAGSVAAGSHRDSRLSDYTKNLMYIMRAKDPKRWTIPALADKFRIRQQRVLAILALKEMEAHRIEKGQMLRGPMSAYALPVRLDDVHLDPDTGAPAAAAAAASGGEGAAEPSGQAVGRRAADPSASVDAMLSKVLHGAHRAQLQLLEALRKDGFDLDKLWQRLVDDVRRARELLDELLPRQEQASGPSPSFQQLLSADMDAYESAVQGVVTSLEPILSCPGIRAERQAAEHASAVQQVLELVSAGQEDLRKQVLDLPLTYTDGAQPAADAANAEGAAASGDTAPSADLQALQQQLQGVLAPLLEANDDTLLQRVFFAVQPPPLRNALLRLSPAVSVRLNAAGVDLVRAGKDNSYRGPGQESTASGAAADNATANSDAAAADAGGDGAEATAADAGASTDRRPPALARMAVDIFGYQEVPAAQLDGLEVALASLQAASSALAGRLASLDPEASAKAAAKMQQQGPPSVADLRGMRALLDEYLAVDGMWARDVQRASYARDIVAKGNFKTGPNNFLRKLLRVFAEADPSSIDKLEIQESIAVLRAAERFEEAEALEKLAAQQQPAQQSAAGADAGAEAPPGGKAATGAIAAADWDAVAAYIDARVVGRVYGRGSGERHTARLASFPAFEGYSLSEFDSAKEGELSQLNRELSAAEDAAMIKRFRQDLMYNLGMRGERLRDVSSPAVGPYPPNLLSKLDRPMVVYGIDADGATLYPPLYVAQPDGRRRPLNEQEQVFQQRRATRQRLPYFMGRVKRMVELE